MDQLSKYQQFLKKIRPLSECIIKNQTNANKTQFLFGDKNFALYYHFNREKEMRVFFELIIYSPTNGSVIRKIKFVYTLAGLSGKMSQLRAKEKKIIFSRLNEILFNIDCVMLDLI